MSQSYFTKPKFCNPSTGKHWERDGKARHYFYPMFVQFMTGMEVTYVPSKMGSFKAPKVEMGGIKYSGKKAMKLVESSNRTYYDYETAKIVSCEDIKSRLIIRLVEY